MFRIRWNRFCSVVCLALAGMCVAGCGKESDPYDAQARARPAVVDLSRVQEWSILLDGKPISSDPLVLPVDTKLDLQGTLVIRGPKPGAGEGEVFLFVLRDRDSAPDGDWNVETIADDMQEVMVPITRGKAKSNLHFRSKMFSPGEFKMRVYYRIVDLEGRNKNTSQDLLLETSVTLVPAPAENG